VDRRLPALGQVGVSEYQYYEFLALDKPLTDKQHAELRKLSSRAEITAPRFVNEYSYGDFRGPEKLMERYFDAFLYPANWGTRRLTFRLPRALLDAEVARRYCHTDAASVIETGDHVIISLYLDRDPDSYWVEADDRLAPMVQARSDLAAGDLRLLYFAWLLGAQRAGQDEEHPVADTEPPVPAGLGDLSASLRAIADFLEIDKDLIAVAAETSPPLKEPRTTDWPNGSPRSPPAGKDTLLTMVADAKVPGYRPCCCGASAEVIQPPRVVRDQYGQQPISPTPQTRPRIGGVAMRSLSCGSAWSVLAASAPRRSAGSSLIGEAGPSSTSMRRSNDTSGYPSSGFRLGSSPDTPTGRNAPWCWSTSRPPTLTA
jgi:hypothetical protein